jgi:Flp pilus assembly CpaE family ATPase
MLNLKTFPFFSVLPTREVDQIRKTCRVQKFTSGTTILQEGEEIRELIFVIEGEVQVVKRHKEKRKTLFTLDPGDVYGEIEILNGTPVLANLVGYQEFQLMFIPKETVLRLIGLYPNFAREVREMYSRRGTMLLEQGMSKSSFGQIVTFFNVKGGAGKSVITANTATLLAKKWRKRVVVVDLNLSFGDQAILFGVNNERGIIDLTKERPPLKPEKIEKVLTHHRGSGVKLLLPPPVPELAEKIKPEFVEQVLDLLRANYDFVLVDTHNQLTELELNVINMSDLVFLVMTMEMTFVKNTKLLLDLFQRMKIPREKVKVILNRAFKAMGLEPGRVETSLKYAISHFIPSEGDLVIPSINAGVPFVMQNLEGSALLIAMEKLCQRLVGEETDKGTWNMFSLIRDVFGL